MLPPRIYVDESHLGRHVTGLERITLELFSAEALAPLPVVPVRSSGGTAGMIATQTLRLPLLLARDRQAIALCPGFPPSIPMTLFGRRVIPYIHDSFLLTRPQDLNWRARRYMAPAFAFALKRLPFLLVNSQTTRADIARFARNDAEIALYRPRIRDVFGIADLARDRRTPHPSETLRLVAIGTVEPRKDLRAAAAIVAALRAAGRPAQLDVIGRFGWGEETEALKKAPGVTLHGYLEPDAARAQIAATHALISTSKDEGLGLTLLEAQHGGLDVIATDMPVYREVLGASGLLVDSAEPAAAAAAIIARLAAPDALERAAGHALANLKRWNEAAEADHAALIARLAARIGLPDPVARR
ncbi:glycosyltransferase involved in cell wall biosynthesis [Kaistia hirudinis]|uniref:Glycosyltransferase involved in cell wall biosynthesis n=1 Tax=Kaistia hirudinis TaxID=1293440 RepID=A0A840APL8_9HYPH|nr:glycosyltransferase [Kaistia hirudinis]MBB3932229.1 glycosyltransferase involved in cell wall biosynthesis [Kaistia hirudinis]MBN9016863.1 glycosyltransferase [Hyphomicrobiales bacterium]